MSTNDDGVHRPDEEGETKLPEQSAADAEAVPHPVDAESSQNSTSASGKRVRRVTPDPNRPKLSGELEEKLLPIDEASARGYDEMEDAGDRFAKYVTDDDNGGVPRGPFEITESLVYEIRGKGK